MVYVIMLLVAAQLACVCAFQEFYSLFLNCILMCVCANVVLAQNFSCYRMWLFPLFPFCIFLLATDTLVGSQSGSRNDDDDDVAPASE